MSWRWIFDEPPKLSRPGSFMEARKHFEQYQDRWSEEHPGEYVVIEGSTVLGFFNKEEASCYCESRDDVWHFEVLSKEAEAEEIRKSGASTWNCICEPFLDTDVPEHTYRANQVLLSRGFTPAIVISFRKLAYSGVWWNAFWGDWTCLGIDDVLGGWAWNIACLGLVALSIAGITGGSAWAFGVLIYFAIICLGLQLLGSALARIERNEKPRLVKDAARLLFAWGFGLGYLYTWAAYPKVAVVLMFSPLVFAILAIFVALYYSITGKDFI